MRPLGRKARALRARRARSRTTVTVTGGIGYWEPGVWVAGAKGVYRVVAVDDARGTLTVERQA